MEWIPAIVGYICSQMVVNELLDCDFIYDGFGGYMKFMGLFVAVYLSTSIAALFFMSKMGLL